MTATYYPLPPETRTLIERSIRDRDEAEHLLQMAILATKAALGVPMEYEIRSLDVGFEPNGKEAKP